MLFNVLGGLLGSSVTTSNAVATAVNGVDLSGILQELISLLPVVLPTIVGFIGIRKAISFLIGSLRRA